MNDTSFRSTDRPFWGPSQRRTVYVPLFQVLLCLILPGVCVYAHTNVTAQQAKDMVNASAPPLVVDVREPSEYCSTNGHIPEALNYPWSSGVLAQRYAELPKNDPILVVCQSGGRSNQAANFLDAKGFTTVYDMLNGMSVWTGSRVQCVDSDHDGINDDMDNCPTTYNPSQLDTDHDGIGNTCDEDFPSLFVWDCIDFHDFAVLASHWHEQGDNLSADLDKNGTVDPGDMVYLADYWLDQRLLQ